MKPGRQWIHFDAQFPLDFGYQLLERFGPAGQLLFVQFLCACKRSHPQGEIRYRDDEEARILMGAHYPFVDNQGHEWSFDEFWKWCGYRKITRTSRRDRRRIVVASRWETWERSALSQTETERKRRSRAKKGHENVRTMSGQNFAEIEKEVGDREYPLPHQGGGPEDELEKQTPRAKGTNPRALGTNPRAVARRREEPPDYPELRPTSNGHAMDPVVLAESAAAMRAKLTRS